MLRQESSLSRRYDHIQPKVDLKLEERFTPAASQVRVPLYNKRRSTFSADNQWKHLEQSANDNLEADQYGTEEEEYTAENLHDIGERPASSAQASPSYSDQIKDYFGRTPSTPETIASPYYSESGSPSYRSKSETQSLTNSPFDSRSSSRTGSFEHPTSNPAGYAIATDSFRRKINERRDYDIVGISRAPPFQRKKTFERGESSLPMETLERLGREKTVRFEGPAIPAPTYRRILHHRRTKSESQVLTPNLCPYEHVPQYGRDTSLPRKNHVGETDNKEAENQKTRGKEAKGKEKADKSPAEASKGNEENQRSVQQQRGIIRKMEIEFQATTEQGKQERAASLLERDQTIEQQSQRIKELEEALESTEEQNVSYAEKVGLLEDAAKLQNSQTQQTDDLEDAEGNKDNRSNDSELGHALQQALQTNEAQAQQIKQLEEALQEKHVDDAIATGTDTPDWQKVFLRKARINTAQEKEINHLKESVKKLDAYNPVLEREVKELRAYVTTYRDIIDSLNDQLESSRSAEQEWKHEYEQQRDMLEQRTFTEETELAELRAEMQGTIAQYQALLPSKDEPDALEITGLMRKIEAFQKTLKLTTTRLETLKKDKTALEQGIVTLTTENRDLLKANEVLKYGPPRAFLDQESNGPLPEWNFEELARKREAAVAEFKQKQKAAREAREAENKLMEKVREAKLGKWHPAKRAHFRELEQRSSWERWEGKRWIDEQSSPEEYDEAKRLGLLEERRKKWRINDWKGKSLGDMGLRSGSDT